jgi:aspartate racemase
MKRVGVIGGIDPASTEKFYNVFMELCSNMDDVDYPDMLINSLNVFKFIENLKDRETEIKYLEDAIAKIQDHVDFIVIVCNTAHYVIEALEKFSKVSILPIYKVVSERVVSSGAKKVGVLGTKVTIKNEIYQKELNDSHVDVVTLSDDAVDELDAMLLNELLYWKDLDKLRGLLDKQIKALQDMGCDGVILGCTELELFVNEDDYDLKLFPSTKILAEAAFKESLVQ